MTPRTPTLQPQSTALEGLTASVHLTTSETLRGSASRVFEATPKKELPVRVRVKICGLTTAQDAEAAIAAGADALGFNTWPGSRRYLDLDGAADWISQLPGFVTKVALCVNTPLGQAKQLAKLSFIDVLQFHGDETLEYCAEFAALGCPMIRAVRLGAASELPSLAQWGTRQVLVDAAVPGAFGGTGCSADLALAAAAVSGLSHLSITIAGGLEPDNVAAAVRRVRPYAVDVASGVESAPGKKDAGKMRAFVQAVLGA